MIEAIAWAALALVWGFILVMCLVGHMEERRYR